MKLRTLLLAFILLSCSDNDTPPPSCPDTNNLDAVFSSPRSFAIGFTTWPYNNEVDAVMDTYKFIEDNADIYAEFLDSEIPWNAWINNTPLPQAFVDNVNFKVSKKIPGRKLLLSTSFLNIGRDNIVADLNGSVPAHVTFNDPAIREAYLKHLVYLVDRLDPDYLVFGMEVNELLVKASAKWDSYQLLASFIRQSLKQKYPSLLVAESMTLHNWYNPGVADQQTFINKITAHAALSDFTAVSFYPFLRAYDSVDEYQSAFDFLHDHATKPIAITETGYIAEDLSVASFSINLKGNECGQKQYLETLFKNAQLNDYLFCIWWTHRDYDKLWEVFPAETKDIGRLWRDTGLVTGGGEPRPALEVWRETLD